MVAEFRRSVDSRVEVGIYINEDTLIDLNGDKVDGVLALTACPENGCFCISGVEVVEGEDSHE